MSYQARFLTQDAARHYDETVYQPQSHDTFVGAMEECLLASVVQEISKGRKIRCLDFACGTGRILAALAPHADVAVGVDVSEAMLDRARHRAPTATVKIQDLLANPLVEDGPFDLITAFRFFLNVEPQLRVLYLSALAQNLRPDGMILLSIQGNRNSVRHLSRYYRSQKAGQFAEMSASDVEQMIAAARLEVDNHWGMGLLPRAFYRGRLLPFAAAVDGGLLRWNLLGNVAQNLVYACRPSKELAIGVR